MQIAQSKINTLKAQTQIAQAKKIYEKHKHKLRKQKKSGKAQFKFRNLRNLRTSLRISQLCEV